MKRFFKYIIPICLIFFCLVGCSVNQIDAKVNNSMLEYLKWIKINQNHYYVSNTYDTISFKVTKKQESTGLTENPYDGSVTQSWMLFNYQNSYKTFENNNFIEYYLDSKKHSSILVSFMDSDFDLMNSKTKKLSNYIFDNQKLNDVSLNTNINNSNKNPFVKKMWWSKSKGIIKFITNDNKIWNKIYIVEYFIEM